MWIYIHHIGVNKMQAGDVSSQIESRTTKDIDPDTITSIQMRVCTRRRIKTYGTMGEKYDLVLNRMMDQIDKMDKNRR